MRVSHLDAEDQYLGDCKSVARPRDLALRIAADPRPLAVHGHSPMASVAYVEPD